MAVRNIRNYKQNTIASGPSKAAKINTTGYNARTLISERIAAMNLLTFTIKRILL